MNSKCISVVLLMLLLLSTSSAQNSDQINDWKEGEEDLSFETVVHFSEYDYSVEEDSSKFDNSKNNVNYTQSVIKTPWIGDLTPQIGEINANPNEYRLPFLYKVELMNSSFDDLEVSVYLENSIFSKGAIVTEFTTIYDGDINTTTSIEGESEWKSTFSQSLDDGSTVPSISYNSADLNSNLAFITSLKVQFQLPVNSTWNGEVDASIAFQSSHNPILFEEMMNRIHRVDTTSDEDGLDFLLLDIMSATLVFLTIRRLYQKK